MTTIRKIITGANRLINNIGSSEELSADDMAISLEALNALVSSYSNNILNIYTTSPYYFQLEAGKATYLLGPELDDAGLPTNADWLIERPMRIEKTNLLQGYSAEGGFGQSTLTISMAMIDYRQFSDIRLRGLQTQYPRYLYDNPTYPCRTLTFWPVPDINYFVELWLWQPLINWANIDLELDLPPGYERMLRFNLAVEIAPEFLKEIPASVAKIAADSIMEIHRLNQTHPITERSGQLQARDNRFNSQPVFNWRSNR